jgi:hypothetical protein
LQQTELIGITLFSVLAPLHPLQQLALTFWLSQAAVQAVLAKAAVAVLAVFWDGMLNH